MAKSQFSPYENRINFFSCNSGPVNYTVIVRGGSNEAIALNQSFLQRPMLEKVVRNQNKNFRALKKITAFCTSSVLGL